MRLAPVLKPGIDQQDKTLMTAGFKPASKQHQYLQLFLKKPAEAGSLQVFAVSSLPPAKPGG
jgi:hypothetical protein